MDWVTILSSFFAAIMGSVVGPIISAMTEDRKNTKVYRRQRLTEWRSEISSLESNLDINGSRVYSEIRPLLPDETRKMIEGNTINIRQGRGGNVVITAILDDLAELEKKWKLLE